MAGDNITGYCAKEAVTAAHKNRDIAERNGAAVEFFWTRRGLIGHAFRDSGLGRLLYAMGAGQISVHSKAGMKGRGHALPFFALEGAQAVLHIFLVLNQVIVDEIVHFFSTCIHCPSWEEGASRLCRQGEDCHC